MQTTWNLFPIVYFGAIDGSFPLEVIEPLWAALDWWVGGRARGVAAGCGSMAQQPMLGDSAVIQGDAERRPLMPQGGVNPA